MSDEICDPKHWTCDEEGPFMPTEMECSACAEAEKEVLRALLREALSKNGPRAHAGDCAAAFGLPASADCTCWMGRARALLGIEEGP